MFLLLRPPPCCLCLHPPLVCPLLLRVLLLGPLLRGTEPQQFYVKFQQYLNGSAMMLSLNTYIHTEIGQPQPRQQQQQHLHLTSLL